MEKKLKILIVDDEQDLGEILCEEFETHGHETVFATSSAAAISCLQLVNFDVVLSDYRMRGGNGTVILEHIKSMAKKPLFIFTTGYLDLCIEECIEAGASLVLTKPYDLNTLIQKIEKVA